MTKTKHPFLIIYILLFSFLAQAQDSDIPVIAYWEQGANYTFRVRKTQEKWEENKITTKENSGYIAGLKVLDSTETSYKLEWSFQPDDTFESESLISFFELIPNVIYTTDENGIFDEILNWKDISDILQGYYQSLMKNSKAELNKEQQESMNELFQNIYSQQGIQEVIMKELQLLHFPTDTCLKKVLPLNTKNNLPISLEAIPLPAWGKFHLSTWMKQQSGV
jgi:hypothetical protein